MSMKDLAALRLACVCPGILSAAKEWIHVLLFIVQLLFAELVSVAWHCLFSVWLEILTSSVFYLSELSGILYTDVCMCD